MLPDALDNELSREPFHALRLHLAEGRSIEIYNPGLCFINRGALYLAQAARPGRHVAADFDLISLRHIVSVEHIEPEAPGNGSKQSAA